MAKLCNIRPTAVCVSICQHPACSTAYSVWGAATLAHSLMPCLACCQLHTLIQPRSYESALTSTLCCTARAVAGGRGPCAGGAQGGGGLPGADRGERVVTQRVGGGAVAHDAAAEGGGRHGGGGGGAGGGGFKPGRVHLLLDFLQDLLWGWSLQGCRFRSRYVAWSVCIGSGPQ